MVTSRVLVWAPRGSGGAYTHLRQVFPRLRAAFPDWQFDLFGSRDALDATGLSGSVLSSSRVAAEFVELPRRLVREPGTLLFTPFGPPLNPALSIRAVWMARNIIPLLPPSTWEVSARERRRSHILRVSFALNARIARRVVCVSEHARALLSELAHVPLERLGKVPHGCPELTPSMEQPVYPAPYAVAPGSWIRYRRTLATLDAWTELAKTHPGLPKLLLVGDPDPSDPEHTRAVEAALERAIATGKVVHLPRVPQPKLLSLMQGARLLVYPSVHEDCPNTILEGMAAGTPIVCADIPATRELLGDAALFVGDGGRPLVEAVRSALDGPDECARRVEHATRRAQHYTWARSATALGAILADAMAAGHPLKV